jgi:hypothetical protein
VIAPKILSSVKAEQYGMSMVMEQMMRISKSSVFG